MNLTPNDTVTALAPPRCLSGLPMLLAEAMAPLPSAPAAAPVPGARLKFWEVPRAWHCSLLGICLTPGELRAIAAKHASVRAKAQSAADVELHLAVVRFACRDRDLGKALTKALDRKHARSVARWSTFGDSGALQGEWTALKDVPGAYWALMSHPLANEDLRAMAAAEVAMLLYRGLGASRAEDRRWEEAARAREDAEDKAARRLAKARDEIARKDAEIAELRRRKTAPAEADGASAEAWLEQIADLRRRLAAEAALRQAGEETLRRAKAEIGELRGGIERLAAENEVLKAESLALAARLEPDPEDEAGGELDDLDGRTILFVGGRSQHIPHYRRLVEERNGTFLHHDGGVDDSIARLRGLFGRADAVLFPVDCVSHMAHDEVKKLCRRSGKPFVPVRRSGFGAFLVALDGVRSIQETALG